MTTPQPSLTVTFENPKMKVSLAGSTSAGLDLGADLGAKLGMQAREKLGVPYIVVDGVEHAGTGPRRLAWTSRRAATTSRCISNSRDYR